MGADAFHVFYGVRWDIDGQNEAEVDSLQRRDDHRLKKAKQYGLQHWWGQTEKEGHYFLLIGHNIGSFGRELGNTTRTEGPELLRIIAEVKEKLQAAGFETLPALHCQFEPDY